MTYAEELLALASRLAKTRTATVQQASFRRAISTAYYALFHLLVAEATRNWIQEADRPLLGRLFSHGKMKAACSTIPGAVPKNEKDKKPHPPFETRTQSDHWVVVAGTFIEAQSQRERADYDLSAKVSKTDAEAQVDRVEDAFRSWNAIRGAPEAQRFLLELLGPRQEKR
jgi:uncharacterized protein (UPF0332 family)